MEQQQTIAQQEAEGDHDTFIVLAYLVLFSIAAHLMRINASLFTILFIGAPAVGITLWTYRLIRRRIRDADALAWYEENLTIMRRAGAELQKENDMLKVELHQAKVVPPAPSQ